MGSYDYILYKLSGVKSLELNWAAESGCFDIHEKKWINEQIELCGIDPSILPKVNEPAAIVAEVSDEAADLLGISQSYISRLEKKIIQRLKKEISKMS